MAMILGLQHDSSSEVRRGLMVAGSDDGSNAVVAIEVTGGAAS